MEDVNDKVPKFEGKNDRTRFETAVSDQTQEGDVVFNVVAFDLDGTSPNNEVRYSWGPNCAQCANFSIDAVYGVIRANHAYDRQIEEGYVLTVQATDQAESFNNPGFNNTVTDTVFIDVLGPSLNPPEFDQEPYTVSILESAGMNATVDTIVAFNPDESKLLAA